MRLRLSNGTDWAFEFDAIDAETLRAGCRRAWRRLRAERGEAAMQAEMEMREHERHVERNLDKLQRRFADRWGADSERFRSEFRRAEGEHRGWLAERRRKTACRRLPGALELHVRHPNREVWFHGDAQKPPMVAAEHSDWVGLWQQCESIHRALIALAGLQGFVSE